MNIVVTGGAGFIGSYLSRKLVEQGHEVSIIDNLSTGCLSNIKSIASSTQCHFYQDTILNEHLIKSLIAMADQVYHLAAAVGVRLILERPVDTIQTNVLGTDIILKICAQYKKRCMIFSSSEVYGKYAENKKNLPLQETDGAVYGPTIASRWSYACSKAVDEFLALAYRKEQALPVTIVRLFNTVGPGQLGRYVMVIPTLVKQALMGKPMTVFGTGQQTRNFIHVQDVIAVLIQLMMQQTTIGEIYNIGGEQEIAIYDLAVKIKALSQSPSEIRLVSYDEAYEKGFEDMFRRAPDTGKLHRAIVFQPQYTLDDILRDVIAYERQQMVLSIV